MLGLLEMGQLLAFGMVELEVGSRRGRGVKTARWWLPGIGQALVLGQSFAVVLVVVG